MRVETSIITYETPVGTYDTWEEACSRIASADLGEDVIKRRESLKTVREIRDELEVLLPENVCTEYFSVMHQVEGKTMTESANCNWPDMHWVAIYAVKGGSEGHYVHVSRIHENKHEILLLWKTCDGSVIGLEAALEVVSILTRALIYNY